MFLVVTGFIELANANLLNEILLKCVSMSNQECKVRPTIMNINSNKSFFILTVFL